MSSSGIRFIGAVAIMYVAAAAGHVALAQPQSGAAHTGVKQCARIAFVHALPKLNGDLLKATVVEVNYGPGESSKPHSHPCAVIGYVVLGSIRTQVKGQPEAILKTGDSFYEAPNGVHLVSANASQTERASFIAFFVCDHDMPLSRDAPADVLPGGK
jgi:quercetin dioxygenase-like cupin family protein